MAKLQVPIDDKLMMEAKLYAITHQTSLKDLVSTALKAYITNTSTSTNTTNTVVHDNTTSTSNKKTTSNTSTKKKEKKKPTPEPVLVPEEEELPEEEYYILRKPGYEGRPETQHTRKSNLTVEWWLEEGDSQYYDEYQNIIPFRYKKADGTDYLPNAAEIKKLEEEYEKPVKIEK